MSSSLLGGGPQTYLALLVAGFLMTQPWRWLGIWLGSGLDVDGEVFRWCRAVSTAIVAALIGRIIVDPSGALADVPLAIRLLAFAAGLAFYAVRGQSLVGGVVAAIVVLVGGTLLST